MHFRLGDQARRLIITGTAPQLPSGTASERLSGTAAELLSQTPDGDNSILSWDGSTVEPMLVRFTSFLHPPTRSSCH
jgi:hypothetical protein